MNFEFKYYLDQIGVEKLVHFTDRRNVYNIKKYGLLSVEELKERKIYHRYNDINRLENMRNRICLSVTKYNHYLADSYINNGKIEKLSLVYINPRILYDEKHNVLFSDRNAASKDAIILGGLKGFKRLFEKQFDYIDNAGNEFLLDREKMNLPKNVPTNLQSEVLCYSHIESEFILGIEDVII